MINLDCFDETSLNDSDFYYFEYHENILTGKIDYNFIFFQDLEFEVKAFNGWGETKEEAIKNCILNHKKYIRECLEAVEEISLEMEKQNNDIH